MVYKLESAVCNMEDEKEAGSNGQMKDADFGLFNPASSPGHQYASYSSWTQFSGMPPPPADQDAFKWDSFVTPPTSPSLPQEFDVNNPHFYTNYNNYNSLGQAPGFEQETVEPDSANLASTPVAQSLLEALSSANPLLNPLSEDTMSMNFNDAASQDGYEIYAEALKKLGSSYGSYDPFGTSDVLSSSPASSTPTKELDSQYSANLKPSYSEVAKTMKSSQTSSKEDFDLSKRRSAENSQSRSLKGNKKFVPRTVRVRNNSVPDDMRPTVSPDSKYGLDDFGDFKSTKCEKEDNVSSGLESIPILTRKNSTSSVSSGTSGIEEIHLTKTCNTFANTSESTPNIDKLSSNKDKDKTFDESIHHKKEEKQFFDARRIFQSKDTNRRRGQSKLADDDCKPTILNNGKPAYSAWCSSNAPKKSTHYINNNLRDSQKKTNQNPSSVGQKSQATETVFPQSHNSRPEKSRSRSTTTKADASTSAKPNMPLQTTFDQELIDEWLSFLYDKAKLCMHQLWTLVLMVILLIFSIIVYLVSGCVHILSWIWGKAWHLLESKVFKRKLFNGQSWKKGTPECPKRIGLEENISLPATGDEAMQRLLACKGKDPYSILGLKASAADEDIKKYYRRQAVLVHPDKNQQPGAEEAFKILGHAFDLIGDSTKRQTYDRQLQEANEAEAAMREFNDLLTKLQEKIQQASNMMRCDNCGGKHKRIPVERPWYSARFCDRCSIRHSAKEGDVWAETSMLGFLWHYYACMEGKVYDITEWVACKKDFFKHMQANAHHVFYRIATEGNRGGHHRSNGGSGGGAGGEADLEDFISHLFHQAMNTEGNNQSQSSWQQSGQTANGQTWNQSNPGPSGPSQGKRGRRRKKKH